MTETQFRKLALSFPEVVESEHMNHPDFRAGGKIFASLGYPGKGWGMVKLSPQEQKEFMKRAPAGVFVPCAGMWGKRGATSVWLDEVDATEARKAMRLAWENVKGNSQSILRKRTGRAGGAV